MRNPPLTAPRQTKKFSKHFIISTIYSVVALQILSSKPVIVSASEFGANMTEVVEIPRAGDTHSSSVTSSGSPFDLCTALEQVRLNLYQSLRFW